TGDNDVMCLDEGGAGSLANSITNFNTTSPTPNRIRVNQRFLTTVRLPGYAGGNSDDTAVENYLLARNTASNALAQNNVVGGAPGFVNTPGGGQCPQPAVVSMLRQ